MSADQYLGRALVVCACTVFLTVNNNYVHKIKYINKVIIIITKLSLLYRL